MNGVESGDARNCGVNWNRLKFNEFMWEQTSTVTLDNKMTMNNIYFLWEEKKKNR